MLDVIFVLLTVVLFAVLALGVRAIERSMSAPPQAASERTAGGTGEAHDDLVAAPGPGRLVGHTTDRGREANL